MKIGIDAKWFFSGPISGIVVIQNLVRQLLQVASAHEYYIFLNKKDANKFFPHTGPNIHPIYIWSKNNMLSNIFVLPQIASGLQIDVVIFQNFSSPYGNFKKIAYIHDVLFLSNPEYYSVKERIYFSPMKLLAKLSDRICTISEEEKKRLLKYNYKNDASQIDVIHHGVSSMFKPIEQHDIQYLSTIRVKYQLPKQFILFVGRLNIRKNIYHLLKALPLLKNRDIPLVIAGFKDWKMFDIDKLINELDIKSRVIFTGYIPEDELPSLFSMASIFCFPSYAEGFGLPALEAMAAGVPVVVSNTTALPEICGEAGNYINPNKPDEIAAAIDKLLGDKEFYNLKRSQGLTRARQFTWEESARKLLKSINTVLIT